MKIKAISIVIVLLTFVTVCFSQEINQQEAIKEFKKGKYKSWGANRDNSVFEDGKVEINIKKNDAKEPIAVMLNTAEYHMNYITDYASKHKIYTNTHFKFIKKSLCMVFHDERLFIFTINYDGSFKAFNSVIGSKIKSFEPYVPIFKKHALEIEKVVKQKEAELDALKKKSNPTKYYAKVYKISEGLKKTKDKEGKVGFLNSENDVAIPFEYDDAYNYFNNGIVGVKKGDKYGYINTKNEVIIPINKDFVGEIHIDLILTEESDGTHSLHDLAGKLVKGSLDNAYWDKSLDAYYIRAGKDHGYIKAGGKLTWVMKNRDYSEIARMGNHYIVVKGNGTGLVDATSLKEILKPTFDMVYLLGVDVFGVEKNEKLGVYVPNKGFVTEVVYDNLDVFKNGKGKVEINGLNGEVDMNGNIAWNDGRKTKGRSSSQPFESWRAEYEITGVLFTGENSIVSKGAQRGAVNDLGQKVIDCKYQSLKVIEKNFIVCKLNSVYGAINDQGETIVPLVYNKVFDFYKGEMKFKKGNTFYWFDVNGILTRSQQEAKITSRDKLVSFYEESSSGYEHGPTGIQIDDFRFYDGFTAENFGAVFVGKLVDKNDYYQPGFYLYDSGKRIEIKDFDKIILKGCEGDENHLILASYGYLVNQKMSNETAGESEKIKVGEDFRPIEIQSLGDGKIISLWTKEDDNGKYDAYIHIWNFETGGAKLKKVASALGYYPCLDVSEDKTRAMVTYVLESNSLITEVMNTSGSSITENLVNYWKKTFKSDNYKPIGCHFTKTNEPIIFYKNTKDKWKAALFKYSENGQTNLSKVIDKIPTQKWTRDKGNSMELKKYDDLYLNKKENAFFEENERTGQMYIVTRFEPDEIVYSYANKSDRIPANVPCIIGIDEEKLTIDAFDFIKTVEDGKINKDVYEYLDQTFTSPTLSLDNAFVTDYRLFTMESFSAHAYDGVPSVSVVWQAFFNREAKSGNVKQIVSSSASSNSGSSNSSTNVSTSSSSSSTSTSISSVSTSAPSFGGSITLKNDTGKKLYIWSGSGSGWLNTGSTKTFSCAKGAKVYYSESNSSSTKSFAFEAEVEQCGKTIKLSGYVK